MKWEDFKSGVMIQVAGTLLAAIVAGVIGYVLGAR